MFAIINSVLDFVFATSWWHFFGSYFSGSALVILGFVLQGKFTNTEVNMDDMVKFSATSWIFVCVALFAAIISAIGMVFYGIGWVFCKMFGVKMSNFR